MQTETETQKNNQNFLVVSIVLSVLCAVAGITLLAATSAYDILVLAAGIYAGIYYYNKTTFNED